MKKKIIVLPITLLLSLVLLLGNNLVVYAEESSTATSSVNVNQDEYADIFDKELRSALNEVLGQDSDSKIKVGQLEKLTSLKLRYKNLKDIQGLQYCTNLKELDLSHNDICDFKPISKLKKLEKLDISYNYFSSFDKSVRWYYGYIDVNCLGELNNLKVLNAKSSAISNVDFLYNMKKLEEVDLSCNYISSIYALSDVVKLKSLKTLDISNQYINLIESKKPDNNGEIKVYPNIWLPSNSSNWVNISDVSYGKYSSQDRSITINAKEFFVDGYNELSYKFEDPDKYEGKEFKFDGEVIHHVFLETESEPTASEPTATGTPRANNSSNKITKPTKLTKTNKSTSKLAKTSDSTNIFYYLGISGLSLGAIILAKKKFI